MDPVEISRSDFHFVTVVSDGVEILSAMNREKTVISDLRTLQSLANEIQHVIDRRKCPAVQYIDSPEEARGVWCILENGEEGHKETNGLHFGYRYDAALTGVIAVSYWSDPRYDGKAKTDELP